MVLLQSLFAGAVAAIAAQAATLPPPPPPPDSFEAPEPVAGEQHLVVTCGAGTLDVLYRWRDRSNAVASLTFWRKPLSADDLARLNGWLRDLRSPAVIVSWCNPFGADMIFEEAYTRRSGDRKRVRITFAYGRLSRIGG